MKDGNHGKPKGSEIPVGEWLEQIGATSIEYVGDEAGGGPPDYEIEFGGERIAVEVRRLDDGIGWRREEKVAFERELKALIEEVTAEKDAPKWHTQVEYDPEEPRPPNRRDETWRKKVREALLSEEPMVEIQLLPPESVRGRGITLTAYRAGNQGSFSGLEEDTGPMPEPTLMERVTACIKEKTEKVAKGSRTKQYDRWWLVLDDEVLIAPKSVLSEDERGRIEEGVRMCAGREQWSKIILMSRFQTVKPPEKQSKWFWALWEDPQHAPLPDSPA